MKLPDATSVIFRGTAMEANLMKGMLESEGIQSYLADENIASIMPMSGMPGGFGSARLMVAPEDIEKAQAIIRKL